MSEMANSMNVATAASPVASTRHVGAPPAAEVFAAMLAAVLPGAYRVARTFTRSPSEAQELVEEAAVRAYRAFDGSENGAYAAGASNGFHAAGAVPGTRVWFMRMLADVFYERYRRRATHVVTEDGIDHFLYARSRTLALAHGESDPAQALTRRLDPGRMLAAVEALPLGYREVAALDFADAFTYAEMAEILDLPTATIRARLHLARRMLKRAMWDLATDRD